jgi:hypothetical protein
MAATMAAAGSCQHVSKEISSPVWITSLLENCCSFNLRILFYANYKMDIPEKFCGLLQM